MSEIIVRRAKTDSYRLSVIPIRRIITNIYEPNPGCVSQRVTIMVIKCEVPIAGNTMVLDRLL